MSTAVSRSIRPDHSSTDSLPSPDLPTISLKSDSLELLRQYQENPDSTLRNEIVTLNLGLVRKEAHHWVKQCTESYEDLLQVGCLGLIRAIERFDLSKGHAFSSFAIPYIRGEIQHYLRDKGSSVRIPRRWLELRQQAIASTRSLRAELNRPPTDQEIAEKVGLSLMEWQEIQLAYQNREPLSLDLPVGEGDEGLTSLGELVPDHQYRSFQLAQEDRIRLQQSLVQLEQRTRDVLEFVFLHDLTQKEVAERMGISVVTVSRRVKKGLNALKGLMGKG
ncbi:RNA polymerase sigma factor SigF [Spirulina subsalsa FACHB-351]|uniref:RNA polymerase sigma factor SigF n=1 Tax=Spirulina subsalsa FACHB-351 TaxID=234711 RepID=A0ABT3L375_9CYAN|nr:RNA polymerase sigma factor SigF [Spirulina subsalsa]MCW6035962.1 RNA polymerase sigma factor SigF [Spirulina subsalsa FACHB-351]